MPTTQAADEALNHPAPEPALAEDLDDYEDWDSDRIAAYERNAAEFNAKFQENQPELSAQLRDGHDLVQDFTAHPSFHQRQHPIDILAATANQVDFDSFEERSDFAYAAAAAVLHPAREKADAADPQQNELLDLMTRHIAGQLSQYKIERDNTARGAAAQSRNYFILHQAATAFTAAAQDGEPVDPALLHSYQDILAKQSEPVETKLDENRELVTYPLFESFTAERYADPNLTSAERTVINGLLTGLQNQFPGNVTHPAARYNAAANEQLSAIVSDTDQSHDNAEPPLNNPRYLAAKYCADLAEAFDHQPFYSRSHRETAAAEVADAVTAAFVDHDPDAPGAVTDTLNSLTGRFLENLTGYLAGNRANRGRRSESLLDQAEAIMAYSELPAEANLNFPTLQAVADSPHALNYGLLGQTKDNMTAIYTALDLDPDTELTLSFHNQRTAVSFNPDPRERMANDPALFPPERNDPSVFFGFDASPELVPEYRRHIIANKIEWLERSIGAVLDLGREIITDGSPQEYQDYRSLQDDLGQQMLTMLHGPTEHRQINRGEENGRRFGTVIDYALSQGYTPPASLSHRFQPEAPTE